MHFVCRAVLWAWAAVLAGVPAQAAESQLWSAVVKQDALTDEVSRRVCAAQDDFRLCFEFDDRGVWASVSSLGSAVFDTQLFPAFRVDQHDAIESVNADVLRLERTLRDTIIPRHWEPGHLTWRAQVPSGSGEWEDTPPLLIGQLVEGERLLVRVYLSGGYQKDIIFPLAGFCAAAAQVYAQGAPALECPA